MTQRWWANADAEIDDWTTDYLSREGSRLRFAADDLPSPRSIPTARRLHAYMMARIFLNVGLNRRIGDGDIHDAHHYAAGAYTDVIITDDGGFRETCAIIPNGIRTISFEDFVRNDLRLALK